MTDFERSVRLANGGRLPVHQFLGEGLPGSVPTPVKGHDVNFKDCGFMEVSGDGDGGGGQPKKLKPSCVKPHGARFGGRH